MLYNDEVLTWERFQAADGLTQGLTATALIADVVHDKGGDKTNGKDGCRYVDADNQLSPVCLIGHVFLKLEGVPADFTDREGFAGWLYDRGVLDLGMAETLQLKGRALMALSTAQSAADEQVPWGICLTIGVRAGGLAGWLAGR